MAIYGCLEPCHLSEGPWLGSLIGLPVYEAERRVLERHYVVCRESPVWNPSDVDVLARVEPTGLVSWASWTPRAIARAIQSIARGEREGAGVDTSVWIFDRCDTALRACGVIFTMGGRREFGYDVCRFLDPDFRFRAYEDFNRWQYRRVFETSGEERVDLEGSLLDVLERRPVLSRYQRLLR